MTTRAIWQMRDERGSLAQSSLWLPTHAEEPTASVLAVGSVLKAMSGCALERIILRTTARYADQPTDAPNSDAGVSWAWVDAAGVGHILSLPSVGMADDDAGLLALATTAGWSTAHGGLLVALVGKEPWRVRE